jgi:uncharacterized membrane protein
MLEKLKSRKFWIAVLSGLLVVLNDQMGWGIEPEAIKQFITIMVGYLIAEGAVDAAGAIKKPY